MEDGHRGRRAQVVVHRGCERVGDVTVPGAARPVEEVLDPLEAGRGLGQRVEAELDVAAVVRRDQVVAQLDPAVGREHVGDEQAVAQRLAHLLAGGGDPGVVHPVRRERVAGRARLGLLVLVVGEAQVDSAAVDVEGLAEVLAGHRRALDVPAGTTTSPWSGP